MQGLAVHRGCAGGIEGGEPGLYVGHFLRRAGTVGGGEDQAVLQQHQLAPGHRVRRHAVEPCGLLGVAGGQVGEFRAGLGGEEVGVRVDVGLLNPLRLLGVDVLLGQGLFRGGNEGGSLRRGRLGGDRLLGVSGGPDQQGGYGDGQKQAGQDDLRIGSNGGAVDAVPADASSRLPRCTLAACATPTQTGVSPGGVS